MGAFPPIEYIVGFYNYAISRLLNIRVSIVQSLLAQKISGGISNKILPCFFSCNSSNPQRRLRKEKNRMRRFIVYSRLQKS
jgi:hypothetical protein